MSNLPALKGDPFLTLKKSLQKWGIFGTNRQKFVLKQIDPQFMLNLISKMGNSNTHRHDKLDSMAIKSAGDLLAAPICFLVNLSIKSSSFANKWKIARIIPLHKGKGLSQLDPKNFRHISLLPVTAKLVERVIQIQMMSYLEQSKQINYNHHAYRKHLSTTTAMTQVMDSLFEAVDENKIATIMTVDESSAFNCVPHQILIEKLRLYNFDISTLNWFQSYLSFRSQFVTINAHDSEMMKIQYGVPQGSVLGPLVYTIFINELPEVVTDDDCDDPAHKPSEYLFSKNCKKCGKLPCYADNASFVITSKYRACNQVKILRNLSAIKSFLNNNYLTINMSKTTICEIMVPQKRCRIKGSPPYLTVTETTGEIKVIAAKQHIRLLGANIQDNFSWRLHLLDGEKAVILALRHKLGSLKHIAAQLPRKSRHTLANRLILSKNNYLVQVWGGAHNKYIKKMQIILNKSARFVCNVNIRTPTKSLMEQCNWLFVSESIKYFTLISVWNFKWRNVPFHLTFKI